jgi:hypothetical protein
MHSEPITVRILNGKNGQPLAHLHLILIGGYDQRDLHGQLFREEALTDAQGQARLSGQLANLPWLQVWVNKKPLCQADPTRASFSVERIRRDGLSSPNRCGVVAVEDAPGLFTVFVQGKEKKAPVELTKASSKAQASASDAAPAAASTAENLARQSDGAETFAQPSTQPSTQSSTQPTLATPAPAWQPTIAGIPAVAATAPFGPKTPLQPSAAAEAGSPASYPPAILVAAALPAALEKASVKTGLAAAAPASTEAPSAAASVSARATAHRSARQADEKSKTHRASLGSRRASLGSHRVSQLRQKAAPVPVSCQTPPSAEKAVRAAAWAKTGKSPATPPANAASATGPSKPPAGVKPAAATPGKASAPPKPDKPGAPSKP